MASPSVLATELRQEQNALYHLERSNIELASLLEAARTAGSSTDLDVKEAFQENIVTIARKRARVEALLLELAKQGVPVAMEAVAGPGHQPLPKVKEALPSIGKEYQQRYKLVNDRLPKDRQRLHRAAEYRRGIDGRARNNAGPWWSGSNGNPSEGQRGCARPSVAICNSVFECTATSSIREQPEFAMTLQNNNENLHDFMLSPCAPLFVHLALKCVTESPEPLEGEGGLAA
ncbi:hypothetical protein QJQ45_026881 [Haematococcus lacustris]|nr:hypothetical protein QJQ45_026881 [Haematococcus lacustris]